MTTYYIGTDARQTKIKAADADAAARKFAEREGIKGVETAAELEAYLEECGGYGIMEDAETGRVFFNIRP